MRLLFDTHAAIWFWTEPDRLSDRVLDAVSDPTAELWVSAASAYELSLKIALGKLPPLPAAFDELAERSGFDLLPVGVAHMWAAGALPLGNRDPWDRILVAQARIESMTLVTRDGRIAALGGDRLW